MDDDIRDRFRGGRQHRPAPYQRPAMRSRPVGPTPPIRSDQPQPPVSTPIVNSKPPAQPVPKPVKRSKPKRGKRRFSLMFVLLIILLLGVGGFVLYKKHSKKTAPVANNSKVTSDSPQTAQPKPTGTVRFIAVGDNLAFDSINAAAKQPDGSYDYLPIMAEFKPLFNKADVRLCNESTPAGGDKNGLAISGYPVFNAPLSWSTSLAGLGCNVINLASDHTNDKGQPAVDTMVDSWSSQSNILAYSGANKSAEEQAKIRYFNAKGIKFAYLAYTTNTANKLVNTYGVNQYSDELANKQITEAHKSADLVLVSINWGTENSGDITTEQDHIAGNLANQNVDVIIGGGPHVLQPAKVLSGTDGHHQTLVWFSLGNFINSSLPVENLIGGMAIMDFDVATQQISDPKLLPTYMHYEWTPAQKAAGTINARHNFKLYPLDVAAAALAKSQNGTTVEAQTKRVTDVITKFVPIKVIKSTEF